MDNIRIKKVMIRYQAEIREVSEDGVIEWRKLRVRDFELDALPEPIQKQVMAFLHKRELEMTAGLSSTKTKTLNEV